MCRNGGLLQTFPIPYTGAGGYRGHDMLAVTEDGARNLTAFPTGPAANIVGH